VTAPSILLHPLAFALISVLVLILSPAHSQDAGTIKLDGKTYRLDGIDAPETDQNCLNEDGKLYPCDPGAAGESRCDLTTGVIQSRRWFARFRCCRSA
jgi:hypothetical protein